VNGLSLRTIFAEPSVLRIEWAKPCLPRHLSRLLLIELAVYHDLQEVDHEKPNKVEPYEADEAPGNGGEEPAESRHARSQDLRADYGGKEFPLGGRRLEKEAARAGRSRKITKTGARDVPARLVNAVAVGRCRCTTRAPCRSMIRAVGQRAPVKTPVSIKG
jgi:hypothetical protein